MNKLWKRLAEPRIWHRIYAERLGEPVIYNLASAFVALFGSLQQKIDYDLILRPHYAYCVHEAAKLAVSHGIKELTLVEFGVASGAGLLNLCHIADLVARQTGINFHIVGFDSGEGMPPPRDYRDHPEQYFTGDFPVDKQALLAKLPANARILFGDVTQTLKEFKARLAAPIGMIAVDVDYYWSTKACLDILLYDAASYLPTVFTYFDDIWDLQMNEFCGELLAIKEFNQDPTHQHRRLAPANFLRERRIFKRPMWPRQVYLAHIFDHEFRSIPYIQSRRKGVFVLTNPHL
jgi:hypothetical protein